MENDSSLLLYGCLVAIFPVAIIVAYARRRRARKKYESSPSNEGPIEGSLDELNRVDPNASPWRNDHIAKIKETMELVERFDTMRGYSDIYMEDLKGVLTTDGIACESVFLESNPIGAMGSLTTRMGIYELYADRSKIDRAKKLVEEFQKG